MGLAEVYTLLADSDPDVGWFYPGVILRNPLARLPMLAFEVMPRTYEVVPAVHVEIKAWVKSRDVVYDVVV